MLRNYIKIAVRNAWKQKWYSIINALGLAVGIASCIMIVLFVRDELSFDTFHSKAQRLYRLNKIVTSQGGYSQSGAIPAL